MPFETFDFDRLTKERRKAIEKDLRPISLEELKKIGEQLFKYADDPWREKFSSFVTENPGSAFYHAITNDGVNVIYCHDKNRGIWFLPGQGMGPLQERGRQAMKEVIEAHR